MIALIVSLQVRPGYLAEFTQAITENAHSTFTDEPGCLYFDVTVDQEDDHHFILYEVYRDEAAVEEHRSTPHFARWRRAAEQYIVSGSQRNTLAQRSLHHA